MSSISQAVNHFPNFQQLSQPSPFTTSTNQLQFRSQSQTSTSFSFVTAEGDRVSLSSGSKENTSLDTYTFQGFADGRAASFQSQQLSTSLEKNFNLLIEGDLNEQEQADIQEFLNSAKTILQELGEGNTEAATQAAVSLGNLESLSQAALFVRQSTSVSVTSQTTRVAVQEDPESHEVPRERSNSGPGRAGTLDRLLEKIRNAQEKFQLDPEKLLERLPKLAARLVDSLNRGSEFQDSGPSIFLQIQKEFLESILQSNKDLKALQDSKNPLANDTQHPFLNGPTGNQEVPGTITAQSELIGGHSEPSRIENSTV